MLKKLFLSAVLFISVIGFTFAQAPGADQRGKTKSDAVVKYVDAKITDAAKKLNANEKKGILQAYVEYEVGMDSLKIRQEALKKNFGAMKAKAEEINTQTAALNQKGSVQVASQEEADKLTAEIQKEKEAIEAKKAEVATMKAELAKEQEALKALPAQLENTRDEKVRKVLTGDKLKFFEEMRAAQKAKK
jgi:predicted  nucleic acid-binding Zn-ribbon protein